jgi:hypothetical protein
VVTLRFIDFFDLVDLVDFFDAEAGANEWPHSLHVLVATCWTVWHWGQVLDGAPRFFFAMCLA